MAFRMFEGIPWPVFAEVGGWSMCVFLLLAVGRLVYTGKLVPKVTVDMHMETIATERQVNAELRAALQEYQTVGLTSVAVLEALQSRNPDAELPDEQA